MQLDYFDSSSNALSSGFPEKMMLFDCETTGGNPKYHRIIEIGLIIIEKNELSITEKGRPFVRNVCMAFDLLLKRKQPHHQLFSMTI